MDQSYIPQGYAPRLNLYDTQKAIGLLKRLFEDTLGGALNLRRVSAPLFVEASTTTSTVWSGLSLLIFPPPGGTPRWSTPWPSGSAWRSTATSSPWGRGSTPI